MRVTTIDLWSARDGWFVYEPIIELQRAQVQNEVEPQPTDENEHIDNHSKDSVEYRAVFSPPVYKQRYEKVAGIIEEKMAHFKPLNWNGCYKIIDFACSSFKFFPYLKRIAKPIEIIAVDIDTRQINTKLVMPYPGEYADPRLNPLNLKIFNGDLTLLDSRMMNADFISMIEIPKIVIITTPNQEFNSFLNIPQGKFRHLDHKFEWIRSQFENWCKNLCLLCDYSCEFIEIGRIDDAYEAFGCCSQGCIFSRNEDKYRDPLEFSICNNFKEVFSIEYPVFDEKKNQEIESGKLKIFIENISVEVAEKYIDLIPYPEVTNLDWPTKIPLKNLYKNLYKNEFVISQIKKIKGTSSLEIEEEIRDFIISKADLKLSEDKLFYLYEMNDVSDLEMFED